MTKWDVVDLKIDRKSPNAKVNGTRVFTWPAVPSLQRWHIDRISVAANIVDPLWALTLPLIAAVFVVQPFDETNGPVPDLTSVVDVINHDIVDATDGAQAQVSFQGVTQAVSRNYGPNGLWVPGDSALVIAISGMTDSGVDAETTTATARIQYRVLQQA